MPARETFHGVHLTVLLLMLAATAPRASADPFNVLRTRWRDYLVSGDGTPIGVGHRDDPAVLATKAAAAWKSMEAGPSRTCLWKSLPLGPAFTSTNITRSFTELQTMALAWATPGSPLQGNADLGAATVAGMDWMVAHAYTATAREDGNWWDWEIGGPQAFTNAAALMYPGLTAAEIGRYCGAIDGHSPGGPANMYGWQWSTGTFDLGFVMVIRGILGKDGGRIATAMENMARVFPDVTTGSGFYADGSFVMHTNKAYTGAYGVILLNAVADMVTLLEGSPWQFPEAQKACVYKWVFNSFEPVIYGGEMMDMVRGRTISRSNETGRTSGMRAVAAIRQIARFAPPDTAEALNRFAASPRLGSGQFPFAGMDRVVALRGTFGFGISMSSARIANYESINGEDLHGWFTGDGMTYLYLGAADTQFGGDYWPTVDPYHLPGTTVEMVARKPGEGAGRTTSQHWVGGAQVSGRYGTAGLSLADPLSPSLAARKSWFMFDREIVCLGAGITCASGAEVDTTVEDRRLGRDPGGSLTIDGKAVPPAAGWSAVRDSVSWCALDGVGGYFFPGGASRLHAAFVSNSGSWSDIGGGTGGSGAPEVTENYLKLWLDHGAGPVNASYSYVLLPNMRADEVAAYASSPGVLVLANSANVQAAAKPSLGVVAANFWAPGGGSAGPITADAPSSVITYTHAGALSVGVSDPTQQNDKAIVVTLDLSAASLQSADQGVTVKRLSPQIVLVVDLKGSLGRTFQASFALGPPASP